MMNFPRNRQSRVPTSSTSPTEQPSLQEEIHRVQQGRTADPSRRRGGAGKLAVGGVVLAGLVALWQFGPRFGWGPGGRGPGQGGASPDRATVEPAGPHLLSQQPQTPQRPLRLTIDGNRYLVGDREVDLATVTRLASEVPAGEGPAVEVKRQGTSRVKAEQDLKTALDKGQVPATWTPPLE